MRASCLRPPSSLLCWALYLRFIRSEHEKVRTYSSAVPETAIPPRLGAPAHISCASPAGLKHRGRFLGWSAEELLLQAALPGGLTTSREESCRQALRHSQPQSVLPLLRLALRGLRPPRFRLARRCRCSWSSCRPRMLSFRSRPPRLWVSRPC
jgi:hypothetical protein